MYDFLTDLAPIVAPFIALIGAILIFFLQSARARSEEDRRIRERLYLEVLDAIHGESFERLMNRYQEKSSSIGVRGYRYTDWLHEVYRPLHSKLELLAPALVITASVRLIKACHAWDTIRDVQDLSKSGEIDFSQSSDERFKEMIDAKSNVKYAEDNLLASMRSDMRDKSKDRGLDK